MQCEACKACKVKSQACHLCRPEDGRRTWTGSTGCFLSTWQSVTSKNKDMDHISSIEHFLRLLRLAHHISAKMSKNPLVVFGTTEILGLKVFGLFQLKAATSKVPQSQWKGVTNGKDTLECFGGKQKSGYCNRKGFSHFVLNSKGNRKVLLIWVLWFISK